MTCLNKIYSCSSYMLNEIYGGGWDCAPYSKYRDPTEFSNISTPGHIVNTEGEKRGESIQKWHMSVFSQPEPTTCSSKRDWKVGHQMNNQSAVTVSATET